MESTLTRAAHGELSSNCCPPAVGRVEAASYTATEFSWEGNDECDRASGRGWAALKAVGSLHGHIYFHLGDDSDCHAVRDDAESQHGTPNVPRR